MGDRDATKELLELLIELRNILSREHEKNWIQGVEKMIEALTPPNYAGHGTQHEAEKYVRNTYRHMVSGNGSFSDYYIWRDEFSERLKENKELDWIREQIWEKVDA